MLKDLIDKLILIYLKNDNNNNNNLPVILLDGLDEVN